MAMTTEQMIDFFGEQANAAASEGMLAAKEEGHYYLATINCGEAFKCRLMKSLIQWRIGTDPSDSLSEAAEGFADDWLTVSTIGNSDTQSADVPAERVAFVAYLIGKPYPIVPSSDGLQSDRLLDLVLGNWLFDSWNGELWEQGMEQLRRMDRTDLSVRTYELYKSVVDATGADLPALSQEGEKLFAKRKSDSFFSGGDQTEGGGPDNDFTVDYRLAALLKRAGFDGTSETHAWKW
ncbi:MAG: hypothetical protein COA78_25985 [Blastopirellula sp.]|nr:MAG: hypothetical protein COA78_25985 [Blastopirellula sp.]